MNRPTPTVKDLQNWVKAEYGFVPQSCWIAHAKELNGIPPLRLAPNRKGGNREKPCPPEKVAPIVAAFRHFGWL
jgi:hypothetical protein